RFSRDWSSDVCSSDLTVQALICYLRQPPTDMGVGCRHIEPQAGLLQGRSQRYAEAALQIAVEAFDLALGLGPVWLANTWGKTERSEARRVGNQGRSQR